MHPLVEQIAERMMDQPLALDARLAGKGRAFDPQGEMAFACRVVAAVTAVRLAVVDQLDPAGPKRRLQPPQHFTCDRTGGRSVHAAYIERFDKRERQVASRNPRMHGRVEGARDCCAIPGCGEPGEYKAPLEPANFN